MKKKHNIFVEGPISANFIAQSIQKHSAKHDIGAHSIFLGQVRKDQVDERWVKSIEYTSYQEMANERMAAIREEAFSNFNLTCMHIYHSLGEVQAGEICLFVFTSSKHRNAATEACQFLVEKIKSEAAIWGKEIFEDGEHQWKSNTPS